MRKVSRIGAAALAVALSVAFATPSTAHAARIPEVVVNLSKEKTNDTYSSGLITKDKNVVFQTTDRNAFYAEYKKYWKDNSYGSTSRTIGNVTTYYIYRITYKNELTGATSTEEKDVNPSATYSDEVKLTSKVYVNAGEPTNLVVYLRNGDTTIKKVKSSKKSVLTATIDKKNSQVTKTDNNAEIMTDKDGNKFYYRSTGEKVYLPKEHTRDSAEYKATNGSSSQITIRLNPKKPGSSKVSFKIYNKDGQQTGKATVKVEVRSDADIFKTVTFAGKSLIEKKFGDTNYINYGRRASENAYDYNFTEKTKGKLVVKGNKGIKIVKIQVGTYEKPTGINGLHYDEYTNTYYNNDNEYYSSSRNGKGVFKHYDYNGDGDYLDNVNGISESSIGYKFKTVKSGKTIKLGRYAYWTDKFTDTYVDKDKTGNKTTTEELTKNQDYAPTKIIITYYNQMSKSYGQKEFTLYTTNKKVKRKK